MVFDDLREVIPNAVIFIEELKTGSSTNLNGNFSITIEKRGLSLCFQLFRFSKSGYMYNSLHRIILTISGIDI